MMNIHDAQLDLSGSVGNIRDSHAAGAKIKTAEMLIYLLVF